MSGIDSATKSTDGPADGDLAVAVATVLRRFRSDPQSVSRAARAQGVAVEVIEASIVASVVADWMKGLPSLSGSGESRAVTQAVTIEATRATNALLAGQPVTLAVRLPPLLAMRLAELAGATGVTPERAACDLLEAGIDPAFREVCREQRRPPPRPWNGGSASGSR